MNFPEAIVSCSLAAIRAFPKSDLHNHCLLGGKRSVIEHHYGRKLPRLVVTEPGIGSLNRWIGDAYRPYMDLPGAFEVAVEAAFRQALADGVTRLEMSLDACFGRIFGIPPDKVVGVLKSTHLAVAPGIRFFPELGFARSVPVEKLLACAAPYFESGYFRSVDLYDDEFAQPVGNFREIYRIARELGMKCKAHAGEFGNAGSVREAVEELHLDAVQHGIGAADSPDVMRWLSRNKIQLNTCPTSNIRLKRVRSYRTHPLRILYDHGVKVTVNTDDALLFGDGVSEQFRKLFRAGLFTPAELEEIRLNGLAD